MNASATPQQGRVVEARIERRERTPGCASADLEAGGAVILSGVGKGAISRLFDPLAAEHGVWHTTLVRMV
jgi:hypothetical protein